MPFGDAPAEIMMSQFFQFTDKALRRLSWLGFLWPLRDLFYCNWVLACHPGMQERALWLRDPAELFTLAGGPPELFPSHQNPLEIFRFIEFAQTKNPRTALEIGTACSGTNFLLAQAISSLDLILGVDLQPRNLPLLHRLTRRGVQRVMIKGPSTSLSVVEKVKSALCGRKIDLLFIDGDHTYEGVKADFETYFPLVENGGIVAFHDIAPDFRTRFGRPTERWAGDVPKFWEQVKVTHRGVQEFVENPDQDGLGIGLFLK